MRLMNIRPLDYLISIMVFKNIRIIFKLVQIHVLCKYSNTPIEHITLKIENLYFLKFLDFFVKKSMVFKIIFSNYLSFQIDSRINCKMFLPEKSGQSGSYPIPPPY